MEESTENRDANEQTRDVYALFGLAIYQAQCVERELAILLTTVYGPGIQKMTRADYDAALEDRFKKTLGGLISALRKAAIIPADFEQKLTGALAKRNWLVHQYLWDRAGYFMTQKGLDVMATELQEAVDEFAELDAQLTATVGAWAEKHGITRAVIDREQAKLIDEANGLS